MGTSTDGILFFGFYLDEDFQLDDDWEYLYGQKIGIIYPDEKCDYSRYWKMLNETLKRGEISLKISCSYECPIWFVSWNPSYRCCCRGDFVKIDQGAMFPPARAEQKIKDFCKVMEIKYQKPTLYLTSLWG